MNKNTVNGLALVSFALFCGCIGYVLSYSRVLEATLGSQWFPIIERQLISIIGLSSIAFFILSILALNYWGEDEET